MGRPQGDHLTEQPVMYVGTVNGKQYERPAYTPTDHVNLKARGWVRKDSTAAPRTAGNGDTAGKRGGRRAPEAASAAPQDDTAAAAGKAE